MLLQPLEEEKREGEGLRMATILVFVTTTKCLQIRWLTSSGGWRPKARMAAWMDFGVGPSSLYLHVAQIGQERSLGFLHKDVNPHLRNSFHNLTTSQKTRLQIASHWGFIFNLCILQVQTSSLQQGQSWQIHLLKQEERLSG